MNDKQMMELAAKAIGLKYHAFVNDPFIGYGLNIGDLETPIWNSLADDGDALRLAVKLKLGMVFNGPLVIIGTKKKALADEMAEDYRYAITRAAAEIGRAL